MQVHGGITYARNRPHFTGGSIHTRRFIVELSQYTPPTPTQLDRVESRRRSERTQFTISSTVESITIRILGLVTSHDIMTLLLKELSISIKIHVVKPIGLCPVSKIPNPSAVVVSYFRIQYTPPTRLDSTLIESRRSRRCALGFRVSSKSLKERSHVK